MNVILLSAKARIAIGPSWMLTQQTPCHYFISPHPTPPLPLSQRCPDGRPRATADAVLGSLRLDRFLACARKKIWWMIPNWGSHAKDLVGETQYMLGEVEGTGEYVCMCGMLDDGRFRSTMRGPGRPRGLLGGPASPDSVCVRVESGRDETAAAEWGQVVYVATGGDPFALAERVVHRGEGCG